VTPLNCPQCGTELAPDVLDCPSCAALVHAETLKRLAADADAAARAGDLVAARTHWSEALALLPRHAQQHAAVGHRIEQLTRQIDVNPPPDAAPPGEAPWWRRGAPGLATVAILVLSKVKFLLLGLTKASTLVSMFAFFGVYWSIYEMGHVAMLRRLGIAATAPMFIPGVGALVLLKQRVTDPLTDAQIGLAGPVWGLGAAIVAFAAYMLTGARIWLAIAQLTGFLNLFNLIPVWQLDGSRGFHVLARGERWLLVAVIALALVATEQRLLFIVGAVAVWRALQQETGPGDTRVLATFMVLIVALAWLARSVG
jgi:Zn-dependent protease